MTLSKIIVDISDREHSSGNYTNHDSGMLHENLLQV